MSSACNNAHKTGRTVPVLGQVTELLRERPGTEAPPVPCQPVTAQFVFLKAGSFVHSLLKREERKHICISANLRRMKPNWVDPGKVRGEEVLRSRECWRGNERPGGGVQWGRGLPFSD